METPGEKKLDTLLSTIEPVLHPDTYVFITLPPTTVPSPSIIQSAQMLFRESEGVTLILSKPDAIANNLEYTFPCRKITLNVHSSLEAVGFIAEIGRVLTKSGIGMNPVSGFFHDHLFVPEGREDEAVEVIMQLAMDAKSRAGS
ncbi:ACT domain-containing protein [Xylogone sp. PMI_703]|nr:ACT domain-containing protein [Xylogone sp. PMI_703]